MAAGDEGFSVEQPVADDGAGVVHPHGAAAHYAADTGSALPTVCAPLFTNNTFLWIMINEPL